MTDDRCEHEWAPTLHPDGRIGEYGQPLGRWATECVKCDATKGDDDEMVG